MLTYSFEEKGSEPLYAYLSRCIKNDILSGAIRPGEKLPSKRAFAKNLGLSVITIENAYGQLLDEGYIYSVEKSGYFASDVKENIRKKKTPVGEENLVMTGGKERYLCDFSSNATEAGLFPFSVWSRLLREELSKDRDRLMEAPPSGGVYYLREAIASYLKEFRAMDVKPRQVIIGGGTEYLIGLLVQLLGIDKTYAVADPGFEKIGKIYESCGADCRYLPAEADGISADELLKKRIDVLHVSPAHHYPLGTRLPLSRRYELLAWAAEGEGRFLIEDDYDSELRAAGRPLSTLFSIDAGDRVIYMNTFTKTLASTIRISYMILPESLVETFYDRLSFYACTVSNFEQYTLARFIDEDYFEKHLNRCRTYYRKKRQALLSMLAEGRLQRKSEILETEAGLHILLKVRSKKGEEKIAEEALKKGVKIVPLSAYYHEKGDGKNNIFVLNYSAASEEALARGIQVLSGIV